MTQAPAVSKESRLIKFKFKSLETVVGGDGRKTTRLSAFPPYGDGYSKFPIEMFVTGENSVAIEFELSNVTPGQEITLSVYPAKKKAEKPDDGAFGSYFWNIDGIVEQGEQSPKPKKPTETPGKPVPDKKWQHSSYPDPTRHSIERQVALKAAVELAHSSSQPVNVDTILIHANQFFAWLQAQTTGEAPEAPQTASSEATEQVYGKSQLTKEQLLANASLIQNASQLKAAAKEYFNIEQGALEKELGPLSAIKDFANAWLQIVEIKT